MIEYKARLQRLCESLGECQQRLNTLADQIETLHLKLEESQDDSTASKLENIMLQDRMNEWVKCCDMFFRIAGKSEQESWDQLTKAATLYQQLKRSQLVGV